MRQCGWRVTSYDAEGNRDIVRHHRRCQTLRLGYEAWGSIRWWLSVGESIDEVEASQGGGTKAWMEAWMIGGGWREKLGVGYT